VDKLKPVLFKKGAEANLYLADWHGKKVVMKKRSPKKYRPPQLDKQVRVYRTIHEPQMMHEAKKGGVPTPIIFLVDLAKTTIIMEFIEGKQLKQLLGEATEGERKSLCLKIGELIGRLHKQGIIHGDLTTSNMILSSDDRIFFVDFGLGEKTMQLEPKGVDLHLMKRALQSTHFRFAEDCFEEVIRGYSKVLSAKNVRDVLDKIREIERRGRYVAERKAKSE
jgi:TP53 regulating kinase-like protein